MAPDGSFVAVVETFRFQIRRYWLKGARAGTSDIVISEMPGMGKRGLLFPSPWDSHSWQEDVGFFGHGKRSRRSKGLPFYFISHIGKHFVHILTVPCHPGMPDGLTIDEAGRFWVPIVSPITPVMRLVYLAESLSPTFGMALRGLLMRMPAALRPKPKQYGLVLLYDPAGKFVRAWHDPVCKIPCFFSSFFFPFFYIFSVPFFIRFCALVSTFAIGKPTLMHGAQISLIACARSFPQDGLALTSVSAAVYHSGKVYIGSLKNDFLAVLDVQDV
jgi:hypothetical protein